MAEVTITTYGHKKDQTLMRNDKEKATTGSIPGASVLKGADEHPHHKPHVGTFEAVNVPLVPDAHGNWARADGPPAVRPSLRLSEIERHPSIQVG